MTTDNAATLPPLPPMLPKGEPWGGKRFDWILYRLDDDAWQIDSRWETRAKAEFHAKQWPDRTYRVRLER